MSVALLLVLLSGGPIGGPAGPSYSVVTNASSLERALESIPPQGGTIVLRPGTYRITKSLVVRRAHVNLVGCGWNTVIERSGDGDALVFQDAAFCTIRDLMIIGDASAREGNGIVFRGQCSSCSVDFVRIGSFAQSGVLFDGDPKMPQSSNTVSRCHFIDNGGDQLRSVSNNDFYILQNQFGAHTRSGPRAPRSGVALWPSSAGTYALNYHWGNRVALRVGPGSHFNRFENNRFEQSRETGVVIGERDGQGCYLNIFAGNTFHTNSEERSGEWPAIEAYGACDTTFTSNQVFSWDSNVIKHKHSLVLGAGCKDWIVKDNIFRHNTGPALVYDANAGHVIKDNVGTDRS
jgi:hypothetical protein